MKGSFEAFKEKLDNEYNWPTTYMFKFVVPIMNESEFRALFPGFVFETKHSKTGKYISFTTKRKMRSSDEIVNIYVQANKIEGIIAL